MEISSRLETATVTHLRALQEPPIPPRRLVSLKSVLGLSVLVSRLILEVRITYRKASEHFESTYARNFHRSFSLAEHDLRTKLREDRGVCANSVLSRRVRGVGRWFAHSTATQLGRLGVSCQEHLQQRHLDYHPRHVPSHERKYFFFTNN